MTRTSTPRGSCVVARIVGSGLASSVVAGRSPAGPTIDDVINLKRVGSPAISPDGQHVAYTVRETNWDENAYETEIWIADAATGPVAAADQREEVQQSAGVVARRRVARVRVGPRRQAAALSHRARAAAKPKS